MQTIGFDSHGTRCEAWYLDAESDELTSAYGRPCVVMAHGFAATRDAGLLPFAERFAAAGADVLVFDYRGFGTSAGRPRQDVDHRKHREDYHAAIAAVRARPGIDPARVALWGSSYSGGHVVAVAAQDPTVRAIISQGPALDGRAALFANTGGAGGAGKGLALTRAAITDEFRALTRQPPYYVRVVGPPGSNAVISTPGAEDGYRAIAGDSFRNEMCGRGMLRLPFNRPVALAGRVACPALLVIAEQDDIAPPAAAHETARRIGERAEVISYDCKHFDVYLGDVFADSVKRQVEFLQRALAPSCPS